MSDKPTIIEQLQTELNRLQEVDAKYDRLKSLMRSLDSYDLESLGLDASGPAPDLYTALYALIRSWRDRLWKIRALKDANKVVWRIVSEASHSPLDDR